jgi:hypothetical protein
MKYDDYMKDNEYMTEDGTDGYDQYDGCGDGSEMAPTRPRMIEVEEVLGTGSAETTTEICVNLCPPAFEVMEQLITKTVEFDALVASKGKVFVNGRIFKDIPYKTRVRTTRPGCDNVTRAVYGNVRHVTVEIPFALCIDVPESFKGAKVVVLDFEVNSVEIPNFTNCLPDACVAKCIPPFRREDPCMRKPICSITEKDCIFVKVKVVKDTIMTIPGSDYRA